MTCYIRKISRSNKRLAFYLNVMCYSASTWQFSRCIAKITLLLNHVFTTLLETFNLQSLPKLYTRQLKEYALAKSYTGCSFIHWGCALFIAYAATLHGLCSCRAYRCSFLHSTSQKRDSNLQYSYSFICMVNQITTAVLPTPGRS